MNMLAHLDKPEKHKLMLLLTINVVIVEQNSAILDSVKSRLQI